MQSPQKKFTRLTTNLHELSEQHMVSLLIERQLSFLYELYTNT